MKGERLTTGQAIRRARERAEMSRKELIELSGIGESSLPKYEADMNAPGLYALVAMADALGISIDELIGHKPKRRTSQND